MAALADDDASTATAGEESDLEQGQDYVPPPPLPAWPRGAPVKAPTPPRCRALDLLKGGRDLVSFDVVRALLGNDVLRAVPTGVRKTMEYSGAEIRVVGLLWRGGGDAEELEEDERPLKADEWLPREVLAEPALLELPRSAIMKIKREADAQEKADAVELGQTYPAPDEDNHVLEMLRKCRPPDIVRKLHPEFATEFDPVGVVRHAERDCLEKVSREYLKKERFLAPPVVKDEDIVAAIQAVAAPRPVLTKPARKPPPKPAHVTPHPFRIGPPAFEKAAALHADISTRPASTCDPADAWLGELYGDGEDLHLKAGEPAGIHFEWRKNALTVVGYVDKRSEARAIKAGGVMNARLVRVNHVSMRDLGRKAVMRRMQGMAASARQLGFEPPAPDAAPAAAPASPEADPLIGTTMDIPVQQGGGSGIIIKTQALEQATPRPPVDAVPAPLFARPLARPRLVVLKYIDANANKLPAKLRARTKQSYENEYRCLRDLVPLLLDQSAHTPSVLAVESDGRGRYLFALSYLAAPRLAQEARLTETQDVQCLKWLARLHAVGYRLAHAGFDGLGLWAQGGHTPLSVRPKGEHKLLTKNYATWRLAFGDDPAFAPPAKDVGTRLEAVAVDIDRWLSAAPRTLIHGDFKGGNIFMKTHDAYVIDWQWCGWGCGVHDVVYYLATTASDATANDYAHMLWLYHHALVNEVGPDLRKARPWPFPDAHRLFMLGVLDYMRWAWSHRLVEETPYQYRQRQKEVDVNCGEYRRSFKRLKVLCDLVEAFLPGAESGSLGESLMDVL